MSPFLRFMLVMLGIDLVGLLFAGLVFPTNRTGQLVVALAVLSVSPVIAFLRVYGRDASTLTDLVE
jgi:hypothetical protein